VEKKVPWLSKTLWVNAVIAVLALFLPSASEWVAGNPAAAMGVMSAINMGLRLITKDKLRLGE